VVYRDVPLAMFLKLARSMRLSAFVIAQLHSFLRDYQRGSFGVGAPTDDVLEVGGRPPEPLEEVIRQSRARRSLGGAAKVLLDLVRASLARAPGIEPTQFCLAADSERWLSSHRG
jgi:hypothetical protein